MIKLITLIPFCVKKEKITNSVFEKIKEKLQERKKYYTEKYHETIEMRYSLGAVATMQGNIHGIEEAIKIINQVVEEYEEDCCEWKFESNTGIVWHCGDKCKTYNIPFQMKLKDFLEEFESECPYCGKKIKVVE